jgi:hypothetical protein
MMFLVPLQQHHSITASDVGRSSKTLSAAHCLHTTESNQVYTMQFWRSIPSYQPKCKPWLITTVTSISTWQTEARKSSERTCYVRQEYKDKGFGDALN